MYQTSNVHNVIQRVGHVQTQQIVHHARQVISYTIGSVTQAAPQHLYFIFNIMVFALLANLNVHHV